MFSLKRTISKLITSFCFLQSEPVERILVVPWFMDIFMDIIKVCKLSLNRIKLDQTSYYTMIYGEINPGELLVKIDILDG